MAIIGCVLILVLVEDGLGECLESATGIKKERVLILVLVEDGLGEWCLKSLTLPRVKS